MHSGHETHTLGMVAFGPFRLSATYRTLYCNEKPVLISSRAFDILVALVEQAGKVVTRQTLIAQVWPDVVVEEANLRVHVAGLRKVLGEAGGQAQYVATVPGRGYCFVAPVEHLTEQRLASEQQAAPSLVAPASSLPPMLCKMFGREKTVEALSDSLMARRFVSLVGPGGAGKTTVAVAVAHKLVSVFGQSVVFVDLSTLSDGAFVALAVGDALGVACPDDDPVNAILVFLLRHRVLLILDNCEHVVEAVARLAERLYRYAPDTHLLTTSRERLRAEGEQVHYLLSLDVPPEAEHLTAAEAMKWPAIRLFIDRAIAGGHPSSLTDDDASIVADICRRLDGLPLAIELAGSWVGSYGIRGTADLLDGSFRLLWKGRRGAVSRHQTMHAVLSWSYDLLTEFEQKILRRLAIFVGMFSVDAVKAIAACGTEDMDLVVDALGGLVSKSLVSVTGNDVARFRLLNTTRAYILPKLIASGEMEQVEYRHANYFCNVRRLAIVGR